MYQLFCDSNCELWYTTVKELGLKVIRMPYTLKGEEYFYDMGENIDLKAFYDDMRAGEIPKTSALNEYAYTEYFEPVLASGEDIYYVTFSHQMSGTFQAMKNAIEKLQEKYPEREIRYFDTKMISLGSGFAIYYAALQYKNGATMDELTAYLEDICVHTAVYFAVSDLTYLYRGGRVSGVSKVVGNLLGIKPILCFDDSGKIINIGKEKGFKKALLALRKYIKTKATETEKYKICIMHADNAEEAEHLAEDIRSDFEGMTLDIHIQPVGPVIGAHCGPGTIGIIFHADGK